MAWSVAMAAIQRCKIKNVECDQSVSQRRMLLRPAYRNINGMLAKLSSPRRLDTSITIHRHLLSGYHAFALLYS